MQISIFQKHLTNDQKVYPKPKCYIKYIDIYFRKQEIQGKIKLQKIIVAQR